MCCNAAAHLRSGTAAQQCTSDHVDESLVATPLPDGYWINAFPFSNDAKLPDLVGYGLGFEGKPASVKLFLNPQNDGSEGWKVTEIQSLDFPVAMSYADLTGDGFNDIIICDRYGPSMGNLWDAKTQDGGRIQWLRNPGDRSAQPYWEARPIGNSTGMHRLEVGHFTTREHFQVIGLPIIAASGDLDSPAPIIIYTPTYGPDIKEGPKSWSEHIAFGSEFRLIHDDTLIRGGNNGLDMVLVAGREGAVLIWFDESAKKWEYNVVSTGLPKEGNNPYWGAGTLDVARVGDDPAGYIASCEGFHGNTVSVYIKDQKAPKGFASLKQNVWKRIQIDDFGPVDPEEYTGTIHQLAVTTVRNNNFDSFAIACMGAPIGKPENQGVYLYTPTDLSNGHFKRLKITDESAGRLAIAGFTNPNRQDIASISYYVPGYHTGPDPPSVRINSLDSYQARKSLISITAEKLGNEVILHLPRPKTLPQGQISTMSLVRIGGKKLTLVVLPPGGSIQLGHTDGAKVIYGAIEMLDHNGKKQTRIIAPPAKKEGTTHIISKDGLVTAGPDGAVFLHVEPLKGQFQGPYNTMSEVVTKNAFPRSPNVPPEVKAMEFPFLKVETLDWASSGLWDDFEFYNLIGFYVYFNDSVDEVVHIQAWTLGIGETARFHNHSDVSFCEIHHCLSNGGGTGGMRYFEDSYTDEIDTDLELTKDYVEKNSTLLVVPSFYEHGPLWKIQPGTQATPKLRENGTVDYPWHAWLASRFGEYKLPIKPPLDSKTQRFDVWLAFEFPASAFQF